MSYERYGVTTSLKCLIECHTANLPMRFTFLLCEFMRRMGGVNSPDMLIEESFNEKKDMFIEESFNEKKVLI